MTTPTPHPWLDRAWPDLGVTAEAGAATDHTVQSYFAAIGHPEVSGDETAWCAAFVGACLERVGKNSTRSLAARSYLAYGTAIPDPTPGAIAVFSRGTDPTLGHVAFVVGETSDGLIILGGNQGHAVSVITMPRSRLLALRWPPPVSNPPTLATPTPQPPSDPIFDRSLAHVLHMEGGYSDDPYDPGGPTNLGLTMADLAAFLAIPNDLDHATQLKAQVAALTPADVAPIYRALYWQPCEAPALPAPLALFHFDTAVNHGHAAAARMLQQALSVDTDGEIGPLTLAAAASVDPAATIAAYADVRRARYRALPTFWRFGRGWLARVDATVAAASALLSTSNPTTPKDPPMTTSTTPATSTATDAAPKWWGQSLTIWGTIITTLSTVLPIVGPLLGVSISADTVHQLGDSLVQAAQAVGGVVGILLTIYGRTRAIQPLVRRDFLVRF